MRQFDAVKLRGGELAVVIQADKLQILNTRVVAPLFPVSMLKPASLLQPQVMIENAPYFIAIEKLTTIRATDIVQVLCPLEQHDYAIRRAIDVLMIGT